MAGLVSWVLLALVGPVLLFGPGYLLVRLAGRGSLGASVEASAWETGAVSMALSLCVVVLVAFVLSQTLGLTRLTLGLTYLVLFLALGVALHFRGTGLVGRLDPQAGSIGLAGSSPGTSVWLVGAGVAILVLGVGLYDGSDPYTAIHYDEPGEVTSVTTVSAGEDVAWTIVVENHEDEATAYEVETRLVPIGTTNSSQSGQVIDEAVFELEDGETREHEIAFEGPDCCTWRVQTTVGADVREDPLTLHRWLHVGSR